MKKLKLLILFLPMAFVTSIESKNSLLTTKDYVVKKTQEVKALIINHPIKFFVGAGVVIVSALTYLYKNASSKNSLTPGFKASVPGNGLRLNNKNEFINLRKEYLDKGYSEEQLPENIKKNPENYCYDKCRWLGVVKNHYYDFIDLKTGEEHTVILDKNDKPKSCNYCSSKGRKCWAMEILKG